MKIKIIVFAFIIGNLACSRNKFLQTADSIPKIYLEHFLSGNISGNQVTISAKTSDAATLDMRTYDMATGKQVSKKTLKFLTEKNYTLKEDISGLKEDNEYKYQFIDKTGNDLGIGYFRTLPKKASSYKIVFGSCAETGSESNIFLKIKEENPLFFLQIGDIHYEDIDSNCKERFEYAFKKVFTSKTQAALLRKIPFVYIWDDHDFGPNNSDSSNPCRLEATSNYKKYIPHYPLRFDSNTGPISQSFSAGRVMYVLTDLRSQKVKPVYQDCKEIQEGTNFGSEAHLNWFFDALLKAKSEGKAVAWVSTYPWINAPGGPNYKCNETDNWGGYPKERQQIADFIKKHDIPIFILSGDAHMVAIDDGSNSDYASGSGAPIPVFQAAALDRPGSYKGGPYSHGYSTARGQYGVIEVIDDGGENICFQWYARDLNSSIVLNQEKEEIRLNFCLPIKSQN